MTKKYLQCRECLNLVEMPQISCSCGYEFESMKQRNTAAIHMFPAGAWEHISADPVYIRGRKQLAQETSARGLTANYLNPGPSMKELRRGGKVSNRLN